MTAAFLLFKPEGIRIPVTNYSPGGSLAPRPLHRFLTLPTDYSNPDFDHLHFTTYSYVRIPIST